MSSVEASVYAEANPEADGQVAFDGSGLLEADDAAPFDRITRLAQRLLGVESARVTLVDRDREVFTSVVDHTGVAVEGDETTLDPSFCKYAVTTGDRFVIDDARESPLLRNSRVITENDVIAYAGQPMKAPGGHVLGVLCVTERSPRHWTQNDIETLEELTKLAVTEIDYRSRLRELEQVQTLALRLPEPLAKLGDAVRSTASLAETPDDPRLLRMADMARERIRIVEALGLDLIQSAQGFSAPPVPRHVDLRDQLQRAARLVKSGAREEDLSIDLGSAPVVVPWSGTDLGRGISQILCTSLHHLGEGQTARASLDAANGTATLTVRSPGHRLPTGDLLRVAATFSPENAPASVSSRDGITTVRSGCFVAHTDADGSEFTVRLDLADDASM